MIAEVADRQPKAILLDAEAVTDIDTTAADEIVKLSDELASRDIVFAVARLQDPARQAMVSAGLEIEELAYIRVAEAVDALTGL